MLIDGEEICECLSEIFPYQFRFKSLSLRKTHLSPPSIAAILYIYIYVYIEYPFEYGLSFFEICGLLGPNELLGFPVAVRTLATLNIPTFWPANKLFKHLLLNRSEVYEY